MTSSLSDYDEDLNQNPFFRTFLQNYLDLFSQCVLERWLICVPRKDSLPQHGRFTIEDFTHHILKPLNHLQELTLIGSNGSSDIPVPDRAWSSIECSSVLGNEYDAPNLSVVGTADGDSAVSTKGSSSGESHDSLSDDAASCDTRRTNYSRQDPHRQHRKWNFETLSGCKIAYDYNTLFLDQSRNSGSFHRETAPLPPEDFSSSRIHSQLRSRSHPRIMRVLFEETFYTVDKQKYKVLCVASPLSSPVEDALYGKTTAPSQDMQEDTEFIPSPQYHLQTQAPAADPSDWALCSLRDCIDFIYLNGRRGSLETYDGFVKLFLHNHKALDDLPLRVQKDLAADVYNKCISAAMKPFVSQKKKTRAKDIANNSMNTETLAPPSTEGSRSRSQSRVSSEEAEGATNPSIDVGLDIPSIIALAQAQADEAAAGERQERFLANFKLATETYILNALYRPLIHALSSSLSTDDAKLNKILRNLADLQPKDLHINEAYWEGLGRAKLELGKIANLGSPLAKLDTLKRTMSQLKLDPKQNSSLDDSTTPPPSPLITSADEMLPMWVYLVIKTPIGNWMAQLEFMKEFRFSAFDPPGSENAFLLTTLEAAVTHLYEDRATSCYYSEFGGGTLVEDRENIVSDEEGATGHVAWLPVNFLFDEDDESTALPLLIEMFGLIRAGKLTELERLISIYENQRNLELKHLSQGVDESKLCHPLCVCDKCTKVLHPEAETGLTKSAFQLQTGTGASLLHMACICGRPKIVEYLLTAGASMETKDNLERTPLHYAAIRGHQSSLLLLCHWSCVLEPLDHMQNTPLHYAALNGHESCLKALVYYGEHTGQPTNLSAQNCNGDTPLHFASRNGYQGIVQILVENGASITLVNARQLSSADVVLNVHVMRILQRSLRRRSLCNVANYGDFVSIEVMKKELSPGNDRVLMLISDPNENSADQDDEGNPVSPVTAPDRDRTLETSFSNSTVLASSTPATTKRIYLDSVGRRSRKSSYNMLTTSMSLDQVQEGEMLNPSVRRRNSLALPLGNRPDVNLLNANVESAGFEVINPKPEPTFEPEHFKTVQVDNLENTPVEIAAAAVAAPGVKRKRKEIGVRKLFTAVAVGDVPLALFYLGISTDELEIAESIRPGDEREALASCHPLCTCVRCIARGSGLGLDINTKNLEGLTPLHLAVMYNLLDLVRILCKYGADIGLRPSFEQKTPAEMAYERQFHEIEDTLNEWRAYYEEQRKTT